MSRKNMFLVILALVVLVLIARAFRPRPEAVDVVEVSLGTVVVDVEEEGETRVRDRFVVSAPLAGRLLRVELEPGDAVLAGETEVVTLQPADPSLLDARTVAEGREAVRAAEAGLGRARADKARAEAALRFAENDLERIRRLSAEQIVARETLESAELRAEEGREALEASRYAVETARHEVALAQSRLLEPAANGTPGLGPVVLRAPVDGVVLRRLRESESVVAPGEPILEIGDPERLEIVSDLLSTDAVRVTRGDRVTIDRWGGGSALAGEVRRVEPSGFTKVSALGVEEQRVDVVVDFVDPREAWSALGDGYRVEIAIEVDRVDDVAVVPTSALFREGDGWAVFRVEGDEASTTPVELGLRNERVGEVKSGLEVGDLVIVHPGEGVADGVEVRSRE